jgi:hypothetical protein
MYPSKDFEKSNHKNAIKHENREPPPRLSHNPKYPPQNILKMTVRVFIWLIGTIPKHSL